jgi:hypothetical protein
MLIAAIKEARPKKLLTEEFCGPHHPKVLLAMPTGNAISSKSCSHRKAPPNKSWMALSVDIGTHAKISA